MLVLYTHTHAYIQTEEAIIYEEKEDGDVCCWLAWLVCLTESMDQDRKDSCIPPAFIQTTAA